MLDRCFTSKVVRSLCPPPRWASVLVGVLLLGRAGAAAAENLPMVRDLAGRVGPIVGSALACQNVARPRVQLMIGKFQTLIREATNSEADRSELSRLFDRYLVDGRNLVSAGGIDCRVAERQLDDLEKSIGLSYAAPVASVFSDPAPATSNATASTQPAVLGVHGIADQEIRFGIVVPYSGAAKESGQSYKRGIEVAFAKVNSVGGVNGRQLKLIGADDGFEPARTPDVMKMLWDKEQVFGYLGNFGTATATVAVPFALDHRALFFAPFSGGSVVRHDPPDRYVFNYRASFAEEGDAAVRYLLKMRKLKPNQIATFGMNDDSGNQAFAGVAKAFRAAGLNDTGILRLYYTRNTLDVDGAVNQLKLQKTPIRAVVMTANARPAAKFIERTRDLFPGMIYTNMSTTGATALSQELTMLGPRFMENVVVLQAVPAVSGYSSTVLDFKNALTQLYPGEVPDYTSLEGFVAANVLIDALKRCGPQVDVEKLVEMLESTRNLDMGLGAPIGFSRGDHQASHKLWGTQLDKTGVYQPIELE